MDGAQGHVDAEEGGSDGIVVYGILNVIRRDSHFAFKFHQRWRWIGLGWWGWTARGGSDGMDGTRPTHSFETLTAASPLSHSLRLTSTDLRDCVNRCHWTRSGWRDEVDY